MTVNKPQTRAEMEDLVRDICKHELRLDELDTQMKEEIQRVREKYEDGITELKARVHNELDAAEAWVLENPDALASKKSIVMVAGTVGYRTGKPKLKTLRGWTWLRVLAYLTGKLPKYVRTTQAVAKDVILADRESLSEEELREMGLKIERRETFYVVPHETEKVTS